MNDTFSKNYRFEWCYWFLRWKLRQKAIEFWKYRITKHSKSDGCHGCLNEAQMQLDMWLQ